MKMRLKLFLLKLYFHINYYVCNLLRMCSLKLRTKIYKANLNFKLFKLLFFFIQNKEVIFHVEMNKMLYMYEAHISIKIYLEFCSICLSASISLSFSIRMYKYIYRYIKYIGGVMISVDTGVLVGRIDVNLSDSYMKLRQQSWRDSDKCMIGTGSRKTKEVYPQEKKSQFVLVTFLFKRKYVQHQLDCFSVNLTSFRGILK